MLRCLSAVAAMAMAMATRVSSATIDGAFSLDAQGLGNLIITTLQQNINPGDVRLLIMQGLPPLAKSNALAICDGAPALIAHLPGFPNNHCFEGTKGANITSNLSCSCLTYVAEDEWTFRLKKQTAAVTTPLPLYQDQEIDLEISSMMLYGVAPKVRKLNIIGVDDMQSIQLMPSPIPGASNLVALVFSASDSVFDTLYVENLSLADYDTKRGFIPSALTNVTIRNCNLTQLSTDLLEDLSKLTYLDVSHNRLEKIYQTVPDECPLRSLDVSFNNIPSFPESVLSIRSLQSLSLEGNPLGKSAINLTLYELLQKLNNLALQLDSGESNCSVGEVRPIGNTQICVNTTSSKPSDTSDSSHTSTYLMYGVIGGCLVIAVLVFVLVKKNGCRSRDETHFTKEPLDGYFDETISYDDTHPTVSASLLNDPIIITNRIPYKDLRVANCISKGGFGLVYSGVYNRRRVAIKKIRPDRAGDIKQIESFLKEICLIATLNHPRVVEFIGVSWDSLRNLCAVTEFMERGDLREVLHGFKLRNTPLTWESHKTTIALHIAEGLTYLHSLSPKVIHRDLKSKNVLLNGEMHAKLSDFGISRERHLEETHMTAGIGTSFWIAPEVLLGKDYDERADIFSFGVVLSEIDTDDYPYWNASNPNVGNKAQENMILQMVASGAMRPSFSDSCPPAVLELADLCLQLDPENRPTAAEVAYELQRIISALSPVAHVDFSTSGF